MNETRTIELIHGRLDGELSASEEAELAAALETSAEARQYLAEMQVFMSHMDAVPRIEPPDDLHSRIMAKVKPPAARKRFAFSRLGGGPLFMRFAMTAAAGLLLAVGIYELRPGEHDTADWSGISGTVMPHDNIAETVVLDDFALDSPAVTARVNLVRSDGELILEISTESAQTVQASFTINAGAWRFEPPSETGEGLEYTALDERAFHVTSMGKQHYSVRLSRVEAGALSQSVRIGVQYTQGGKLLSSEGLFKE